MTLSPLLPGPAGLGLLALLAGATMVCQAAPTACPPYVRHTPGGDYNNADDRRGLALVEFHFPAQVESLTKGVTGQLGGDIGYTLEHFPNHARALAAMARLGLRDKSGQPLGAKYSILCYFERATGFAPADAKVRTIYGAYLLALGQADAAMAQLTEAVRLAPDNATGHYNLGLLYLNKKDYPAARRHAQLAYALGFPLPGLKNRLSAAGQWPPESSGNASNTATTAQASTPAAAERGGMSEDGAQAGTTDAGAQRRPDASGYPYPAPPVAPPEPGR